MKFLLSILLVPLITGAYASNVLELNPSNFDTVVGQGVPGLVELCVPLSDLPLRAALDVTPASHPGGMSLLFCCIITLLVMLLTSGHCKVKSSCM
jgi:hypothetical protein